ncbi:desmocollin 2-like protein [Mastacembelus armatus]|uniref:Desmocollin 1 n=1 Tax=Mastacembelus armatus TaxID=205130 RepID=A0A3Q3M5M4_9TELE|nr:desmocollin-3 [Mastacembelus armatus]
MANVLIFNIVLMMVLPCVETCFIPNSLYIIVPQTIPVGYEVTKVEVADCDAKSMHLTLKDPSFKIKRNGAIVASAPVPVSAEGRTFSVWVQDNSGPASEMEVHLVHSSRQEREHPLQGLLKRTKRKWRPSPFNVLENDKGPFPKEIDTIVSDSSASRNVYYTLTGPGYNEYPVGVFSYNTVTGMLSVTKAIDREEFPSFTLTARVFDQKTHEETDLPLPVHILIDDVNDNAPQFVGQLQFTVLEHSNGGTIVGLVNTTDRDDPKTDHVKVRYSLLSGSDLFAIHPETGVITTRTNTLDREAKDTYLVTIQIKDKYGADTGLQNTGTATITLGDINDNPPTFTKASYEASVPENESEKLILRIPVEDKDLINTPNWISKFIITKGNENGNFRIDTDPKTNEGLLYVTKPLDYEKNKNVNLEIMARNEAELRGTSAKWLSVPVNVNVLNVDEGPEFTAPTVWFTVKENTPNGTVIGTYTAIDPETKSSNGIKYYKTQDPAFWINVDRNTGELKVANTIDRESSFVQNGLYNITMKAVDATSKTGTGTVVIQVEDLNDNIPVIPGSEMVLCEKEGGLGSVVLVAEDKDQPPFSSPFTFSLPPDNDGKWTVTRLNETSAVLKHVKELPTGIYNVPVDVRDLQGSGRTQTAKVRICQCKNGACLAKQSSVALGPLALLAMLLPLALLLLLGALLAFFCVTKGDKIQFTDEGDSGGILLKSNTEGKGEEVDPNLLLIPAYGGEKVDGTLKSGWQGIKSTSTIGAHSTHENGIYKSGADMQELYSSQHESQYGQQLGGQFGGQLVGSGVGFDSRHLVQDSSLLHTWKTNGRYLHQKLDFMGREDGRYADDIIHTYGFEGRGSAAGSVGCCSDYGDKDNLDFINTLGPKFKTLADICTKK